MRWAYDCRGIDYDPSRAPAQSWRPMWLSFLADRRDFPVVKRHALFEDLDPLTAIIDKPDHFVIEAEEIGYLDVEMDLRASGWISGNWL